MMVKSTGSRLRFRRKWQFLISPEWGMKIENDICHKGKTGLRNRLAVAECVYVLEESRKIEKKNAFFCFFARIVSDKKR